MACAFTRGCSGWDRGVGLGWGYASVAVVATILSSRLRRLDKSA